MRDWIMKLVPGLIAGAVGGVVGYALYKWGLGQGLQAGVVPGAFIGLGSGLVSDRPSRVRGAICGIAALAVGIYAEWQNFPFNADGSLGYFLAHIHTLKPLVLIMIALGAFLGYRWGGDSFKPRLLGMPSKPPRTAELPESRKD
jgi:hypothetical protein